MTMNNLLPSQRKAGNWKNQSYIVGAAAGLLFGLLSAYMFNRSATDAGAVPTGENRVSTGELLGLGLALLAIIRQVAEMGRPPEPKKGRK
jgi:hypothetical protein